MQPLIVFIVEPDGTTAAAMVRRLREGGLRIAERVLSNAGELRAALLGAIPDAVVVGAPNAAWNRDDALRAARAMVPRTPTICAGEVPPERLADALAGAVSAARESASGAHEHGELIASRNALAAMLDNVDTAISSYSIRAGRYLYVSPAAERVYGRPLEDFYRDHEVWRDIVHPDDAAGFFAARERLMRDGSAEREYRVLHADGSIRWIHQREKVAYDAGGAPVRVDSVGVDVTSAVEQRSALQRLGRIRDVLAAVGAASMRAQGRDALCREACRIATTLGGLPAAAVVVFDREHGAVDIPAFSGPFPRDVLERAAFQTMRDPGRMHGVMAAALRHGAPAVDNDIGCGAAEIADRRALVNAGVGSIAAFPFTIDEARRGVVILASHETRYFNGDEIELLSSLAANLGFALELVQKRERLAYLSRYDPLTDLPNRTFALERLSAAIESSSRAGARTALIVIDLRRFAALNTTLGQSTGDEVLREVARRLVAHAGASCAARLTADRFAVIVPQLTDVREVVSLLGSHGITALSEPLAIAGRTMFVPAHAGCAVSPDDGTDAASLFRAAEAALQAAKASDAPYRLYSRELEVRLRRRLDLEARLRRAVARGEFMLHYQPKVDLGDRSISGVEALIRWRDPERPDGLVPPIEFIPALEETGLIVEVGRWALFESARQHAAWYRAGLVAPRIAVNVSAVQLRSEQLAADVAAAIAAHGCGIDLEVTESAVMQDMAPAVKVLNAVRDMGVNIAMDDFGTGYSSLSKLLQLPVASVKIDRSFIDGVTTDTNKITIVSAIISLARGMQLYAVAEGVETEAQAKTLHAMRCNAAQGFLTGRPMPADALARLLPARLSRVRPSTAGFG